MWFAACGIAVTLAITGCASPASGPSAPSGAEGEAQLKNQQQQQAGSQCEPGKEAWRGQGAPKRGGTIVRDQPEWSSLDPTTAGGRAYFGFGIYEYLVRPRACYFSDTTMAGNLAKSWQVSPDGLTWTIKLQDNVRYQNKPPLNGRAFTSADVAWTFEYMAKETDLKSYWSGVAVETPDPQTVVLKMKEPDPDFIYKLGDERNIMLPREIKEQFGDFKRNAVGTGAFQLKSYTPDQEGIVERNPNYWNKGADGQPLPYVDEIRGIVFADAAAEIAALRAGRGEHTHGEKVRKIDSDALKQGTPKNRYYADPAATIHGLWFNPKVAPFNDIRVRQALSLAIDRDDIIAADGGGGVYQGFVPQSLDTFAWPLDQVKEKFKVDQAKARKLLEDAKFSQDKPFVFKTGTIYAQQLEVVAKQLELVGVRTKIEIAPGGASGPVIRSFDYDLAWGPPGGGRFADYWVGDLVRTGAGRNVSRLSDAKLDQIIDAQKKELDQAKRKVIVDQIQDYLYDQMPYVPTVSRVYYGVLACRIKNMTPNHQSTNYWGFEQAWIDPAGC